VIRIEPAPFLAAEQLGRRKFLSSLYGEIFLQDANFERCAGASQQELVCPKLAPETMDVLLRAVSCEPTN
jgi:hypothetical protein